MYPTIINEEKTGRLWKVSLMCADGRTLVTYWTDLDRRVQKLRRELASHGVPIDTIAAFEDALRDLDTELTSTY